MVAFYFRDRVDEEIRCRVVELIADHYRGLTVTVRWAGLVDDGIEIRGLSIRQPDRQGPGAELLYIDEMSLACTTDLQELIRGTLEVRQITIRRPTLRVAPRPDETWNISQLFPLPQLSEHPPAVTVENGTVEIIDPLRSPHSTFTLREINLTLSAPDASAPAPDARTLEGSLSADHVRRIEIRPSVVGSQRQAWTLAGTIDGLDVSPEMRHALPEPLSAKLALLGDLRGQASVGFRVACDPAAAKPYAFEVSGQLVEGRVSDSRLPHPLTDMRVSFRVDDAGLTIDDLFARSGQTTIRIFWARQEGLQLGGPMALAAEVRNLQLDHELRDRLGESLQEHWDKYRPTGRVNAKVQLYFDGVTLRSELSVECLDVSFTHHKFNYRLDKWKGNVTLKDDVLDVHLNHAHRNRQVRVTAKVFLQKNASSAPAGWFEAEGWGLELDDKLLDALPGKSRQVVASLNPRGTIDFFRVRLQRDAPGQPQRKDLWLCLKACSIRYDKFPYPIGDIYGTVQMHDDHWTFGGLRGRNDSGWITCEEGYLTPPAQGQELFLRLLGDNVPLEPELRDALPVNVGRLWNNLRPQGTVNLVTEVYYRCPTKQLSIVAKVGVGVPVRAPSADAPGNLAAIDPGVVRPVSIHPVQFPYRMENLRGVLEYRDGHVTLHGFQANHGPVTMAASGYCVLRRDGSWDFQLEGLKVDRLRLKDPELIRALPGRLKQAILALNPAGPIYLRGSFGLEGGAGVGDPARSRWDLAIDFHQAAIDSGIRLENLCGSVTLAGGFDGQRFYSRGEIDIDSLTYKDYQFTEVRGPIWIDDRQALFGSWVGRRRNHGAAANTQQQPRPLTAKLFGGIVTCDPWIALGQQSRYGLHATLSHADLSRCAQETMAGRQDLKGKIFATVDLGGAGQSLNALAGQGKIHLRDAGIYELPLMFALLKILGFREPDKVAFNKSDIDFRIQGNHIYFSRIDFNGDAISLLGWGEMDLQHNIDLTFHAVVGNDEIHVPLLRELVGGASQQIMQIRVGGSLQDPKTEKIALPGVQQALQQVQDGLQRGGRSPRLSPPARPSMPEARQSRQNRR